MGTRHYQQQLLKAQEVLIKTTTTVYTLLKLSTITGMRHALGCESDCSDCVQQSFDNNNASFIIYHHLPPPPLPSSSLLQSRSSDRLCLRMAHRGVSVGQTRAYHKCADAKDERRPNQRAHTKCTSPLYFYFYQPQVVTYFKWREMK